MSYNRVGVDSPANTGPWQTTTSRDSMCEDNGTDDGEEDAETIVDKLIRPSNDDHTAPVVLSSWPDMTNDSAQVASMVDPSFPSLFGTGATGSATSSRANSQSASPFARSNGLGTPPPFKLRKLREHGAPNDGDDSFDATFQLTDIVLVKCPVPSEVMARWPCKDWSSKLFMTLLYQCVADTLSLSYFIMQFVSFNHPCSMWTNETPLEASVRQRLSMRDRDAITLAVRKTLRDFFPSEKASSSSSSSTSKPKTSSAYTTATKVRSYMLYLFGKHVSFKETFAFALAAMSSHSNQKHDLNVSGLADYILDDMSWFVNFPLLSVGKDMPEDTFALNVFSFFIKGVIDASSQSFKSSGTTNDHLRGVASTDNGDDSLSDAGEDSLLSMGLILFFSVWSMHTNFSSEPSRMRLLWTTVCQLQSSAGFTFKCALTRPSVLAMLLIQSWRAFVLQLMRNRADDVDATLRADCNRALSIFNDVHMERPSVDALVSNIEKFYVWLCERLVKSVSKWCKLTDDLQSIPLDDFDYTDGSASTFVKSLVVSKRTMVRIKQLVGAQ